MSIVSSTPAESADIPVVFRALRKDHVERACRLRQAIREKSLEAMRRVLLEDDPEPLRRAAMQISWGRWTGWLGWTVTCETMADGQRADSNCFEKIESGMVKELLDRGWWDWTAWGASPGDWENHPTYQAVVEEALKRLTKLPAAHPIFAAARRGGKINDSPNTKLLNLNLATTSAPKLSWLNLAVDHLRVDVVQHWASHAPVAATPHHPCSAWAAAWGQRLIQMPIEKKAKVVAITNLLEDALTHAVKRNPKETLAHRRAWDDLNDEVSSLLLNWAIDPAAAIDRSIDHADLWATITRLAFNYQVGLEPSDKVYRVAASLPDVQQKLGATLVELRRAWLHVQSRSSFDQNYVRTRV